jgi:hypothetical protein
MVEQREGKMKEENLKTITINGFLIPSTSPGYFPWGYKPF